MVDASLVRRTLGFVLTLLVGLPLVALPLWVAAHRVDLPTPGDEDLVSQPGAGASGPNGFEALRRAAALAPGGADEEWDRELAAARAPDSWDPEWLDSAWAGSEAARRALDAALVAPRWRMPLPFDASQESESTSVLLRVQELVRLAGAVARLEARRGRTRRALDAVWLGQRLASKLGEADDAGLLEAMFATALRSLSLQDLSLLLADLSLSAEQARELVGRLESHRWGEAQWRRVWATEYRILKRAVEGARESDEVFAGDEVSGVERALFRLVPPSYLWQPNRTLAEAAELYRARARRFALPCSQRRRPSEETEVSRLRVVRALVAPNPVGNLLVELLRPNGADFPRRWCRIETRTSLLEAAVAIKAYVDQEGELPHTLESLVPAYLPRLPGDSAQPAPLRYSRPERLLEAAGWEAAGCGADPGEPIVPLDLRISLDFASP